MSEEDYYQPIPARHGTATFVPQGSTIKIVNSSGTQVIDTWAFALPDPPKTLKNGEKADKEDGEEKKAAAPKKQPDTPKKAAAPKQEKKSPEAKKGKKGKDLGLPSQEEAEAATAKGMSEEQEQQQQASGGWTSYLPSLPYGGGSATKKAEPEGDEQDGEQEEETEPATDKAKQKANSRTWGSYLSTGTGFTSYLPSKGAISAFANSHQRDPSKSYAEQLADFQKTPVGAAGFSAITGSGAASSLYAGYSAWNKSRDENPAMEYLSLPHTRAKTLHLCPREGDVLVSNLRQPMLTVVEDTSGAQHDTLMAACDPARYAELGVKDWAEHGSCAENLVLALKEINERAGLKGAKGIGADVTINAVPAPLNLFMNVPWSGDDGKLSFATPKAKKGGFVRLRAERDVVVVMSACPQDQTDINGKDREIQDGQFTIETPEDEDDGDVRKALAKTSKVPPKKRNPAPKKLGQKKASAAQPEKVEDDDDEDDDEDEKPKPKPKAAAAKKPAAKPAAAKKPNGDTPKPAAAKKPNGDTPKPSSTPTAKKTDASAGAEKPKAKPKKLVDTNGEKKKPKKLDNRSGASKAAAGS